MAQLALRHGYKKCTHVLLKSFVTFFKTDIQKGVFTTKDSDKSKVRHLSKEEIIKNGSIFTPKDLVLRAKELILPHIGENTVTIDFGAGYGAFTSEFLDTPGRKIATDIDEYSVELLKQDFPQVDVRLDNSLLNISRNKFATENEEIVVIGNPPYNDVTSQYQRGNKGSVEMDDSIRSQDLGISFLRMYGQIEAKYICVLHPFSYLLKKQNFKRLKEFANHYRLIKAVLFSSHEFESIKKSNTPFPVLIALYERNDDGMSYEYIKQFKFDVYKSDKIFQIKNFNTIDGVVTKYPTKDIKDSDLQFYSLRDINALRRNRSFLTGNCHYSVKVNAENLHYYSWLDFFKKYFKSDEMYLYGNLSPLLPEKIEDKDIKGQLYAYILNSNAIVSKWFKDNDPEFFKTHINNYYSVNRLMKLISVS